MTLHIGVRYHRRDGSISPPLIAETVRDGYLWVKDPENHWIFHSGSEIGYLHAPNFTDHPRDYGNLREHPDDLVRPVIMKDPSEDELKELV